MIRRRNHFELVVFTGIISTATSLTAQETINSPAATSQYEIVVSASRNRREAYQIPANVTVINAKQIEESGANNVVDILKNLDGIYFRSYSGNNAQAEVSMRGFGENSHMRVLILIDGRRLNRPDMASINWAQLTLGNIERIEILRGSQSALYGNNAVGGVINIITKKGGPTPKISVAVDMKSYQENNQRMTASGSQGPMTYAIDAERSQVGGYRDRSRFLSSGASANIGYDFNENNNLNLYLGYDTMKYQMPGDLTKAEMEENPRQSIHPNNSAKNDVFTIDLGLQSLLSTDLRLECNLSYGRTTPSSDMATWDSFSDTTIDSIYATPRLIFERELFDLPNKFMAGFDYYLDRLKTKRYSDEQRLINAADAKINRQIIGIYVRDELNFTDAILLGLGARVEHQHLDAKVISVGSNTVDQVKTHNANALEAGLIYLFPNKSKIFTRFSTVYRYPSVDEQVSYIGYSTDRMYMDLEPEKGQNYEAGMDIVLLKGLNLGATFFLLNMRDEIAYNTATWRNENMDDTRHMGAETYLEWRLDKICKIDANYTYTDASFISGENKDKSVPLVPRIKTSVGIKFFLPLDLSAEGIVTYIGSQHLGSDYANLYEKLPSYTLVDVALHYTPRLFEQLDLDAFIGVDNLLDKQYASSGYRSWKGNTYYPSPDRTYKAGLACRF